MTTLHIVIYPEEVRRKDGTSRQMYVAAGLEHFIVGQGATVAEAMSNLERAILTTLAADEEMHLEPLQGIKPAPQQYHDLFERSSPCMPDQVAGLEGSAASAIKLDVAVYRPEPRRAA